MESAMKIGILSMQNVKNSGSFLQAYALMKEVQKYSDDVEFLSFELKPTEDFGTVSKSKVGKLRFLVNDTIRKIKKQFVKNTDSINHLVKDFYNLYEEETKKAWGESVPAREADIDILIIGSDEVFNVIQYVEEGYECPWELFGKNINAGRIVSYAASCGYTRYDSLKKYGLVEEASCLLKKFSSVSVRDENTMDVTKKLGVTPYCHIDPVLLYDFDDVEENPVQYSDYILVYAYSNRISSSKEIRAIKEFARKHNKKLICINELQYWCDVHLVMSPLQLLSYFKHADYVITDTFHGSVISIKYNKQFGVIVRNSNSEKIGSLLRKFSLQDRQIKDISHLADVVEEKIDYSYTNDLLQKEKHISREYICSVLRSNN